MNSYALAERVHREVNASVTYRTDLQQFGVPEWWTLAGQFGDCEDYALLKRARLLAASWPLDRISLVTCLDEQGAGHCVLYVDTDNGVWILDNRHDWPMRVQDLHYSWQEIEQCGQWHEVYGFSY